MAFKNDQVSQLETERILAVAKEGLAAEGDFVELGCYKGDTALLLAELLRDFQRGVGKSVEGCGKVCGKLSRRLWIYDSFEGLPEKNEEDFSEVGAEFKAGELFVTKREVKERLLRAGLSGPVIKKAWFSDLTGADMPEKIAFAFLDGDFYEWIRDSLKLVEGRMVPGGAIVVHDYSNLALPGVRKAVDEWLLNKDLRTEVYQSLRVIKF